ncbi:MAG: sigma-54 dependent transcriptional regulator [Bdellovibrionales bacterium]|nr:sigma-54 dependent transcriptional regulator [Bdellovibrionales bacterium]
MNSSRMSDFKVLVVDDEDLQRETLVQILTTAGYQVCGANGFQQAEARLVESSFDLCLTDFRMPGRNGLDVARLFQERAPETLIMIMTAYADVESVIEAMHLGAIDYLIKPIQVEGLLKRIASLQESRDLKSEIKLLRLEMKRHQRTESSLLGDSRQMKEVKQLIQQVATTRSTVLITGESGTGKEVAARAIHEQSRENKAKFVAINCGAIPENLLESELFGHRRGAFTGAHADKEGLFRLASGGTLFLDEIGDMPKSLQVKLLRALQEREITPVGGTTPFKIDVRLIAATNRDLHKSVEDGSFRHDLFFRINVIEIKMPSLRSRMDDIPIYVRSILNRLGQDLRRPVSGVTNEAMNLLLRYSWPGNIRELENVLERALILAPEPAKGELHRLTAMDLPVGIRSLAEDEIDLGLDAMTKVFQRNHIAKLLEMSGGDKKAAAARLGLSLSSMYRKIEELEISN